MFLAWEHRPKARRICQILSGACKQLALWAYTNGLTDLIAVDNCRPVDFKHYREHRWKKVVRKKEKKRRRIAWSVPGTLHAHFLRRSAYSRARVFTKFCRKFWARDGCRNAMGRAQGFETSQGIGIDVPGKALGLFLSALIVDGSLGAGLKVRCSR